jgi:hypothetical protein
MVIVVMGVEHEADLPVLAPGRLQSRLRLGGVHDPGRPGVETMEQIGVIVLEHGDEADVQRAFGHRDLRGRAGFSQVSGGNGGQTLTGVMA